VRCVRISGAAFSSRTRLCCKSLCPTAVVPTTNEQSATASATVLYTSAVASVAAAPTAERASRNATSYGFTSRRWGTPKLLMARAAAPILRGLRTSTRTTRNRANSAGIDKLSLFYGTYVSASVVPLLRSPCGFRTCCNPSAAEPFCPGLQL